MILIEVTYPLNTSYPDPLNCQYTLSTLPINPSSQQPRSITTQTPCKHNFSSHFAGIFGTAPNASLHGCIGEIPSIHPTSTHHQQLFHVSSHALTTYHIITPYHLTLRFILSTGAVATIFATVITYPLQTLRTRRQAVDLTTNHPLLEPSLKNNKASPCLDADDVSPCTDADGTSPCRPCKGELERVRMHDVGHEESVGVKESSQLLSTDNNSSMSSSSSSSSSNDDNDNSSSKSSSSKREGSISSIGLGLGSESVQPLFSTHPLYCLRMCYSGVGLKILSCAVHGFTFYLVKNVISRYYSSIPPKS